MEVALEVAKWFTGRWWGKPFGWLIYAVVYAIMLVLLLICAALLVSLAGGVLYGIGYALLSSNPLSVGLFLGALALAALTAFLWDSIDHQVIALPVGALAVAVGIAWLISIPGDPPKPGSRAAFCAKHNCIGDWQHARGYRVQCADGAWSFSGGIQGSCSSHGGTGSRY